VVDKSHGWWRRWLHNATGDRDREAAVLAKTVAEDMTGNAEAVDGKLLATAKEAVAIAHGDGDRDTAAASDSEIATPADVVKVAIEHGETVTDEQSANTRSNP
jgi:hypothetical protein